MEEKPASRKMSTGLKVGLIGCGTLALLLCIGVVTTAVFGIRFAKGKLDEVTGELKEMGFKPKRTAQVVRINDPINEKSLYVGQVVKMTSDATTDVAIVAQTAEIRGKIKGKIYFRGQLLTIHEGAEVSDGLDVKAQVVHIRGKVEGEITGTYQTLQRPVTDEATP